MDPQILLRKQKFIGGQIIHQLREDRATSVHEHHGFRMARWQQGGRK